jgi:heme-degrading monooxygenase HmoA
VVKHIVMWRLKAQADGRDKAENARLAKARLEALAGTVPGILRLEVGINFSPEEGAADIVLYSEFESRAALEAYQLHPAHLAVKPFIGSIRVERRHADYDC